MSGEPTILTTKEKIMKKTDKIITNNLNDQIAQLFSTLKMPAANQTFQNQQKSPDYPSLSKYFLIANQEGTEKIQLEKRNASLGCIRNRESMTRCRR